MTEREFLDDKNQIIKVDFRKIGSILWNIKYILLASMLLCLVVSYFYTRYSAPVYKKSIAVVLKSQQTQYSDNYQLVSSTLGVGNKSNSDNQIFILKSTKLMSRVVELGNFNVRYFSVGRFIENEEYTDSPIEFSFAPDEENDKVDIYMEIAFASGGEISIDSLLMNNEAISFPVKKIKFGQVVKTSLGCFDIKPRGAVDVSKLKGRMHITLSNVEAAARGLSGSLEIVSSPQQPDALVISLRGKHPKRMEDILNILIDEYNILAKENDSQSILNTITFLDERIAALENELEEVETSSTKYRTANELVDLSSQSQIVMSSEQGYKERSNELRLQLNLLNNIKKSFNNNTHELIPANIGITDGALNSSISQYNEYVLERDRMLAASSDNNPKVQMINDLLVRLRENIKQSIDNLETGYKIQLQSTTKQQSLNQRELIAVPSKQLALTRMSRLQQVKEPLYILLQQKREEALLMLSSLSDQAYVVDKAFGSNQPISPRGGNIYMFALILSLIIPISIVLIINIFRNKVIFEKDVLEKTDIPLLGIIPSAPKDKKSPMKAQTITAMGRDPLTESFRMLRTKLETFTISKKKQGGVVIQISSSGPWEGKSFCSINMSLSLAYLGKKVLLIGADLHKPALSKYLGIDTRQKGLSSYLAGFVNDIHEVIISHESTENLEIIPAGPIPLNPSELLALPLLEETLDKLRNEYDYIIVDSAPFLVVSSGFIVSKYVDCTLYIVRSNYTKYSAIDALNSIVKEGSLKSVMIILNAVDFDKKSIYGVSSSSQGYAYGYGYGYIEHDKKKKK